MEQLSFFEKLGVLFDNIIAHPLFICILLIPVLIIFFNKKITKKAVVLIYIAVLIVVLFIGNTTIFSLFDNLIDGVFMALYFPNFITLFLVEVLSAIICLITFIKKDITKTSKIINITGFAIIQTIFALILTVIQANEIDIYKENALYASNDVLTLMQLLMGTFFLQIVTLLVVKAIDKITKKLDGEDESKIIEHHTIKLPEGRITHAKLGEKIIIREPQTKEKPKEIIKEPEIKLESKKPIKPLDKSLIQNTKIKPININEEINKPKPTIIKETTEVLGIPKEEKIDTKQSVKEKTNKIINKISSTISNTKEYISKIKENNKLVTEKPKEVETKKPETVTNKKDQKQVVIPNLEKPQKEKKQEQPKEIINPFDNFKPEFPDAKTNKFVNQEVIKEKPDLLKPMDESLDNSFTSFKPEIKEEKELITNLQIVDYEKTIKAIKNLSTVYTL